MKNRLLIRIITITLITILGILILSISIWIAKPRKQLSVFILNKTVPTKQRYDHRAISWMLQHEKYVKSNNVFYKPDKDYFGFYPIDAREKNFNFKSLAIQDIELVGDTTDIVYYADTYGVYYNDWYANNLKVNPKQKVYGGLNHNDYLLLKKMKENKKTIITEFVLFDNPTSELVRTKTENLFDLKWQGWVGRYFHSLDPSENNSIPKWIVKLYKDQNKQKWPFQNSGVVLVHKYGKVVVLENNNHLDSPIPKILTDEKYAEKYNLPKSVNYPFWFDIVSAGQVNDTISYFDLNTNEKGDSLLGVNRINSIFPAVIGHKGDYTFYYFAGDFADTDVKMWSSYFAGAEKFNSLFSSDKKGTGKRFFWKFYNPLMKNILKCQYNRNNL